MQESARDKYVHKYALRFENFSAASLASFQKCLVAYTCT